MLRHRAAVLRVPRPRLHPPVRNAATEFANNATTYSVLFFILVRSLDIAGEQDRCEFLGGGGMQETKHEYGRQEIYAINEDAREDW